MGAGVSPMSSQPTIGAPYSEIGLTANAFDHPEWLRAQAIQITVSGRGNQPLTSLRRSTNALDR